MKQNRNYAKAVWLFLNYLWNRRERERFHEFLVYLGPQQWDATHLFNHLTLPDIHDVKTQLNKRSKGKFRSTCVWGAPWAHQPPSRDGILPPSEPREEPSPSHSILSSRGTRCSKSQGIPWGKGGIKWDKHTLSNWFTDSPFTGFLVNNQVYSLQVQTWYKHACTGKPKSTNCFFFWSFPLFVLSGEAGIQVSLRLYPEMSP